MSARRQGTGRLVALVAAMLFMMSLFASALAPLLPQLKHDGGLSTFQTGLLVAVYGVGAIAGLVPAALAAPRVGVKPTALVGLAVLAVATAAFGLARGFDALLSARLLQGAGDYACGTAALAWLFDAVPRARRGQMTGVVFGAGAVGGLAGPLFGALAVAIGRGVSFGAVAVLALALALFAARFPAPPPMPGAELRLRHALSSRAVRTAVLLSALPALLGSAIGVLGPLQLHRLGAGAGAIAACFAAAALVGTPLRPIVGRWSDRSGPRRPLTVVLAVSLPIVVAIPWVGGVVGAGALIALALIAGGDLWAPLLSMLSDACVAAGATQVSAMTLVNLAGAPASAVGPSGAAAIGEALGQRAAYAALGALLLAGVVILVRPVS